MTKDKNKTPMRFKRPAQPIYFVNPDTGDVMKTNHQDIGFATLVRMMWDVARAKAVRQLKSPVSSDHGPPYRIWTNLRKC